MIFLWSMLVLQQPGTEFISRDEMKLLFLHGEHWTCNEYARSFRCSEVKHWLLSVNDVKCADRTHVSAFLKSEAARVKTPSDLRVTILAESGAPYSEVSNILHQCALTRIYRVELGEMKTKGKCDAVESPLGVGTSAAIDHRDLLILIGAQKPDEFQSVRWVKGPELKAAVEETAQDFGPRPGVQILLDPHPSTMWTEVIRIMDDLKKAGFERIEYAAPKVSDEQKK